MFFTFFEIRNNEDINIAVAKIIDIFADLFS